MHPDSPRPRRCATGSTGVDAALGQVDEGRPRLAQRILDEDHCGLEKVKERIVSTSRRKLKDKMRGPLLCFVPALATSLASRARWAGSSCGSHWAG
jgi:hypothetical protein